MSVSWTSHARELQRSVFPSLSFGASAGPSLKSTTRTTRTISLTQKDIQKCFVLASSTTGVFSPWRPASSKAVVRCTLQKTDKKLTEADVEVNTLKIYETWWNMIANNHTKLKETKTTKLDALLHVANNFANFNDLKRACHQFQWPSALVVQLFEAHEDVPPRVGVFTVTTVTARSSLSTSPTGLTNCFLNFITIHSYSFKRSWQWWNVVNVVN